MSTLRKLKAARGLIAGGWTRGEFARNRHGTSVNIESPAACRFCVTGALYRVYGKASTRAAWAALVKAGPLERAPGCLVDFNDDAKSKNAVLALFDRAIAAEESP